MQQSPGSAETPRRDGRILTIDGARGVAMILVFIAHFSDAYYGLSSPVRHGLLTFVTRVASPAFVWISGIMLGILYHRHREHFERTRNRLIDRGLFLILVGHPLIAGAHWPNGLRIVFITDTIGVAVIVGALLIARAQPRTLAVLGAGMLLTSWMLLAGWAPVLGGFAWRMKALFIGDWRGDWLAYNFPPLPWLGLYLIAAAVGRLFAQLEDRGERRRVRRGAVVLGLSGISLAMLLKLVVHGLVRLPSFQAGGDRLMQLGSIREKLPPSPGYILFYSGLALLIFAAILSADRTAWGASLNRWTALFGRCSLACFVAQFYTYYVGVALLPHPRAIFVPLYFLATLALLRLFATVWDRAHGNRYISVGLPSLLERWPRRLDARRGRPAGLPL